jgi:hypothetical protein
MRALAFSLIFASCGPRVSTTTPAFERDLDAREPAPAPVNELTMERDVAPAGKGLRTGTIQRASLLAVLDAGPAQFLRQFEVAAKLSGRRFVGWQLVQLVDPHSPLADVDLVPGDVLLAVNGQPLSRPDQLQTVWDSLRTANQITAQLWRGTTKLSLEFAIEPRIEPKPAPSPKPAAGVTL